MMDDHSKVQDSSQSPHNSPLLQFTKYISIKKKKTGENRTTKYDPFKSPPDFLMAMQHGLAKRVCQEQNSSDDDDEDDSRRQSKQDIEVSDLGSSQQIVEPIGGKPSQDSNEVQNELSIKEQVCPCCGLPIKNKQIDLLVDPRKFSHLGITYTLYFQFIKKCFILVLIQFCMSGSYNLILNNLGTTCALQQRSNFICNASVMNILKYQRKQTLYIQSLANFMTTIVLIVVIEMFKINQEVVKYSIEKHQVTPADFTIEIKGFKEEPTLDQVETFVHTLLNQDPVRVFIIKFIGKRDNQSEICKIYFLFDMKPYSSLYQKKLRLYKKKNNLPPGSRERIKEEILDIDRCLDEFEHKIQDSTFRRKSVSSRGDPSKFYKESSIWAQSIHQSHLQSQIQQQLKFSGTMLVTLNNSKHAKMIVENFERTQMQKFWNSLYKFGICKRTAQNKLSKFFYQENLIKITRAPEPSDIMWINVGSQQNNYKIQILINLSVLTIFLINLGALVYIKRELKQRQSIFDSQLWTIALSLLASTIVALTNTLIGIILRKFAGLETHKRQTDYFISVGKNLSNLYFINMVATTLGSNMLSINLSQSIGYPFNIEGLMYDFFFLFITNSYLSSLFNYFDIMWGIKLCKRRKHLAQNQKCKLSQQEANHLFEGHPADMALRYANVLKLMFFSAVVSPSLPIGLMMSMLGLIILYWIDKYLLLRRYVCPYYLDSQLADAMMDHLSLYTIFLSFGNILIMFIPVLSQQKTTQFVWPEFYSNSYFYVALIGLLISVCYRYLVKIRSIKELYFRLFQIRIPKKKIRVTYQEQQKYFRQDYENYHPVLREYCLPGVETNQDQEQKTIAPDLFKEIKQSLY